MQTPSCFDQIAVTRSGCRATRYDEPFSNRDEECNYYEAVWKHDRRKVFILLPEFIISLLTGFQTYRLMRVLQTKYEGVNDQLPFNAGLYAF